MKNWYNSIAKGQKVFLFVIAAFLILVGIGSESGPLFLISLAPMLVLIYLALGSPKKQQPE